MSRYNESKGGNADYDDSRTLKLQRDAAVRLEPDRLGQNRHEQYGTSFILNSNNGAVLDGIVFERDDKPGTWKVMSGEKVGFHLNRENGLVYENFDEDTGEYSGQMSAQDLLDHPRVAGFSETFGGTDYFYTPIGVVLEEAGEVALNDDIIGADDGGLTEAEAETARQETIIPMGEVGILEGNKTWVRTFAKHLAEAGDNIINDNGKQPTARGEESVNPKYDDHEWLSGEPDLRSDLKGRTIELWVKDEVMEVGGERVEFASPYVLDTKTGEYVSINNKDDGESQNTSDSPSTDSTQSTSEKAADGGTVESGDSTDSTDENDNGGDDGLPSGVPEALDKLLDYLSRNNDTVSAEQVREMAEDEVENPEEVDWEKAAEVATDR